VARTTPVAICVMPVKNEAWVLERSLTSASSWADVIIVADQDSTDDSAQIASGFEKVRLIRNSDPAYSEHRRQTQLIDAAREVQGPRLILSLDADEVLSANVTGNAEWEAFKDSPPGTAIRFPKAELLPGLHEWFELSGGDVIHGFVDDGRPYEGGVIHGPRLPVPPPENFIRPRSVWLLHLRATDTRRNDAKQRWYQCWEAINNPSARPVTIFRTYHQHLGKQTRATPPEWTAGYKELGLDLAETPDAGPPWWEKEILALFERHGPARFRKFDVFDSDVSDLAHLDPRSPFERLVHAWLRRTQSSSGRLDVRLIQRGLRRYGW
jgi:hypothetical protein